MRDGRGAAAARPRTSARGRSRRRAPPRARRRRRRPGRPRLSPGGATGRAARSRTRFRSTPSRRSRGASGGRGRASRGGRPTARAAARSSSSSPAVFGDRDELVESGLELGIGRVVDPACGAARGSPASAAGSRTRRTGTHGGPRTSAFRRSELRDDLRVDVRALLCRGAGGEPFRCPIAGCAFSTSRFSSSGSSCTSVRARTSGSGSSASRSTNAVRPSNSSASWSALSCRGSSRIRRARRGAGRGSGRPRARPSSSTRRKNGDGGVEHERVRAGLQVVREARATVCVRLGRGNQDAAAPELDRNARRQACRRAVSSTWVESEQLMPRIFSPGPGARERSQTRRRARARLRGRRPPRRRRAARRGGALRRRGPRQGPRRRRARARRSPRSRDRPDGRARAHRCPRGRARPRRRGSPSRSASRAVIASGPPRPRATSSACFTSANRSLRSFDAEPSTPRPTRHPASTRSRTGATPAPSRRLEVGQCATPVPVSREASDLGRGQVDAVRAPDVVREPAEPVEVLDGRAAVELAAVLLLLDRLGQMRVEREAEAPRERGGLLHQPSRDGERRARRDGDLHARAGAGLVELRVESLGVGDDRVELLDEVVGRKAAVRARRGPSIRATRRCARRAPAPPGPPPRRSPRARAGRRSGGRRPSSSRRVRALPAPSARRRTPPPRRVRAHTG